MGFLTIVMICCTVLVAFVLLVAILYATFPRLNLFPAKWQFLLGGAFAQACHRLQDSIPFFDFANEDPTPEQIRCELERRNNLVRKVHHHHCADDSHEIPILVIGCMDRLLSLREAIGDSRHIAYFIRLAGSILSPEIFEMIELVIRKKGVKMVVFTTHSDCAAEAVAKNDAERELYPMLSRAIDERTTRFDEFMRRPLIARLIDEGKLVVQWYHLDTKTFGLTPVNDPSAPVPVATTGG